MADISDAEIKRLAGLARIGLSDEEVTKLATDIDAVVGFVEQLQSVDVTGVEPTSQVTGLNDVWRPDEVKPCTIPPQELLANVPERQNGYIRVRRVL